MRFRVLAAIAAAALATMSCGGGGLTDPANNDNQVFTGQVGVGQTYLGFFTVNHNGEYSVTLNSLTPPFALFVPVEVAVGTAAADQSSCSAFPLNSPIGVADFQTTGKTAQQVLPNGSSDVVTPGTYCFTITDLGRFTTTETFSLTVSHP